MLIMRILCECRKYLFAAFAYHLRFDTAHAMSLPNGRLASCNLKWNVLNFYFFRRRFHRALNYRNRLRYRNLRLAGNPGLAGSGSLRRAVQNNHVIGDNFRAVPFYSVLAFPIPGLQPGLRSRTARYTITQEMAFSSGR